MNSAGKETEEAAAKAGDYVDFLIMIADGWKVIPLENLIAEVQGGKAEIFAGVKGSQEAKTAIETLEIGADGVLLSQSQDSIEPLRLTLKQSFPHSGHFNQFISNQGYSINGLRSFFTTQRHPKDSDLPPKPAPQFREKIKIGRGKKVFSRDALQSTHTVRLFSPFLRAGVSSFRRVREDARNHPKNLMFL